MYSMLAYCDCVYTFIYFSLQKKHQLYYSKTLDDETNNSLFNVISTLNPEMEENINMNNL